MKPDEFEPISEETINRVAEQFNITDIEHASIGEVLLMSSELERITGIPFVRMDQGSPGLPPCAIGLQAEKEALDKGVASLYPAADGIPPLKENLSEFIKAFINIDIPARCCIPTAGSVAGSFGSFIAATQCSEGRDKVLFIDPGFPIQRSQLKILGIEYLQFDIYPYRGEKLKDKIESYLMRGDIAAIIYSNPNNPAWICLEESELETIGKLATRYGTIVLEDLAYFGMDFRRNLGRPWQPPYVPTVARYTDNYIIMLSSSKIFSYAGQRMAAACVSEKLFDSRFSALAARYGGNGHFGSTFVASILYMITSGVTHTTQYGYAAMLKAAVEGKFDFVEETSEYARRANRMKKIFTDNGFHIVYDYDVTREVGDGFFFTIGYEGLTGGQLLKELLGYGVSSISLDTTGSLENGVRACSSRMREELYPVLEKRMRKFNEEHKRLKKENK